MEDVKEEHERQMNELKLQILQRDNSISALIKECQSSGYPPEFIQKVIRIFNLSPNEISEFIPSIK